MIYQEYLDFERMYGDKACPQMDDVYPNGSIPNWDKKWPTVNLRCYGLDSETSKFFPKTMAIVNKADVWLSHVMFSILEAGKFIPRHRGLLLLCASPPFSLSPLSLSLSPSCGLTRGSSLLFFSPLAL